MFMHFMHMPELKDKALGIRIKAVRRALGETQAVFGERFRVEQGTVSRWENGSIPVRTLWASIAEVAGVSPAQFFMGTPAPEDGMADSHPMSKGEADQTTTLKSNASNPVKLVERPLTAKLPRYRFAHAGQGGAVLMDSRHDDITAPEALAGIDGSFACFVHGDSMEPFLFAGDTVFCHGFAPPRGNDFVVLQVWEDDENGHLLGLVKQFVRQDATSVTVRQFNPLQEFTFPRERVKAVNKVIQIDKL